MSSTRLQVDAELASAGLELPWTMEVDQFSAMLGLVQHGRYLAVLPSLFDADRYGLKSLALDAPTLQRHLFFLKRRDSSLSPQAEALAGLLRDAIAQQHPVR